MRGGGWRGKHRGMGGLFMQMEMSMRGSGPMTRQREPEHTHTLMEPNTWANGRRTNSMARVSRPGPTAHRIRALISRAKSMESGTLSGQTRRTMRASFLTTTSKVQGSIFGRMDASMWAIGSITRCMVRVSSSGWMGGGIQEVILMTRRRVMGFLNGPMADATRVFGRRGASMARARILHLQARAKRDTGSMATGTGGLMNEKIMFTFYFLCVRSRTGLSASTVVSNSSY